MSRPWNPEWGSPFVGLRLPEPLLETTKKAAQLNGTTLSGYIREAIMDRLEKEGVDWQPPAETTPGQITLDDAIKGA